MPLPVTDFSRFLQNPDYSGISDMFSNYYKGYEMGQTPEKLAQERLSRELQNRISGVQADYAGPMAQQGLQKSQLENQYYGREKEAHIKQMLAQAMHYNDPRSRMTGLAAESQSLAQLLADPSIPEFIKEGALKDFENRRNVQESLYGTRMQNQEYKNLNTLPADQKEKIYGQYNSLGIDPRRATELWNSGQTPENIVANQLQNQQGTPGLMQSNDYQNLPNMQPNTAQVPVQPALTSSDRSAINVTKGALAEEAYIAPKITDAMKGYSEKIIGYSPKQFWDTFKDSPNAIDKMAKFYAARALQPEIAGNRARLANSSTAHQAIDDIKHDSLNAIKIMDWKVKPEAYAKAQEYISEWIQGMAGARINGMQGLTPQQEVSNQIMQGFEQPDEMVWIKNQKTGERKQISKKAYEASTRKKK
jgi:hypothetical protein